MLYLSYLYFILFIMWHSFKVYSPQKPNTTYLNHPPIKWWWWWCRNEISTKIKSKKEFLFRVIFALHFKPFHFSKMNKKNQIKIVIMRFKVFNRKASIHANCAHQKKQDDAQSSFSGSLNKILSIIIYYCNCFKTFFFISEKKSFVILLVWFYFL